MDPFMIGIIGFIILVFVARMINERANKKLDQEKKALLVDLFSKDRIRNFGIIIAIIILFFVALHFQLVPKTIAFTSYFILIIGFLIYSSIQTFKKLEANGFPKQYIKAYTLSSAIRMIGLMLFLAVMQFYK